MQQDYDLIIIGAGASGLTAARVAGLSGKSVLIIDRATNPCEKVYISGGGKCNFSNKNIKSEFYFSNNPHFAKSALARFTTQNIIELFNNAGVLWQERPDGKLFAFSGQAVRLFLLEQAQNAGVIMKLGIPFFDIEKENEGFVLKIQNEKVTAKNVLIATGGLSYPGVGATRIGYDIAKKFGLNVIDPQPALVSLNYAEKTPLDFASLAGISLDANVKLGKKIKSGGLLFTKTGFSGPAILQSSLYWQNEQPISIDFLPNVNLLEELKQKRTNKDKRKIASILHEFLPKRMAEQLEQLLPTEKQICPITELSDKNFALLVNVIKDYTFIPPKTAGWQKAEVTKGGIDTNELSSATLESKKVKGLFFSGEVIDVTGEVGGYNLHWAWASGNAVGQAIANQSDNI